MIVRVANETLVLTRQVDSGGQSCIWLHPHDEHRLVKIYIAGQEPEVGRLEYLLSRPADPLEEGGHPTFTWPLELAIDPQTGAVVGYVMHRVEKVVPLARVWNPANRIRQISQRWLVAVARSLCMRVYVLHWYGYLRVDINAVNDLIDRHARVTSIDVDSVEFRANGNVYRTPKYRPEFQAPEVLKSTGYTIDHTKQTDVWSLAVVLHMLLRGGEHPFNCVYVGAGKAPSQVEMIRDGRWIDEPGQRAFVAPRGMMPLAQLPIELGELFRRTFRDSHRDSAARPTVLEFIECLENW